MEFEAIRMAATIILLAAASYYDLFNRKNVPVNIPYAMIALGFLINLATLDVNLILSSTAAAVIIFAAGYVIYRAGQIGGADVLVFAGISLLLPSQPSQFLMQGWQPLPIQYPFIVPVFLISGLLAIIGLTAKYLPKVVAGLLKGRISLKAQNVISAVLVIASYSLVVQLFSQMGILSAVQSIFLLLLVSLAGFLTLFKDYISSSMVEWVPLARIDDEDVIALQLMDQKVVNRLKLQPVLTKDELAKLRKLKMKKFPVYTGMPPFLPYMLLAVLFLLVFGDPISILAT